MKKRIVIVVLIITLVALNISFYSFASNRATSKPTISVSSVSGRTGDVVDVAISLSDNPGIVSMTLNVKYDSHLKLVEVKDTGLLPGGTHKATMSNPYTLSWVNDTATSNYNSNGCIAIMSFKIGNSAVTGKKYSISISYDNNNYDIFDKDVNCIDFEIKNGTVMINNENSRISNVSINDIELRYKGRTVIVPEIKAESGVEYTVAYQSSNPDVVTVDDNGTLIALKNGEAIITCEVKDLDNNSVYDTCRVVVKYTWWQWIIVILLAGWLWY